MFMGGLPRQKVLLLVLFLTIIVSISYYHYFSKAVIEDKIFAQRDYSLELLTDNIAVQFDYNPEWALLGVDQVTSEMQRIYEDEGTNVYIEKVLRQPDQLYISLIAVPKYNFREGTLLFVNRINTNGTFTTTNKSWTVIKDGRELTIEECNFGMSVGPGNRVGIDMDNLNLSKLNATTQIKYNGFLKYRYRRN